MNVKLSVADPTGRSSSKVNFRISSASLSEMDEAVSVRD